MEICSKAQNNTKNIMLKKNKSNYSLKYKRKNQPNNSSKNNKKNELIVEKFFFICLSQFN
jgi:hypothetical protein